VKLRGLSLLQWSVNALQAAPSVSQIVVALPPGVQAPAGTLGAPGGAVRSESVREALSRSDPSELVLVHDAARPLLTPELAEAVLAAVVQRGVDAAVAAAAVSDTIKRAQDCMVVETLSRSELWAVQTPQAFRRSALEKALSAPAEDLAQATDDASLVERDGGTVAIVRSSPENLKVTTRIDLELAAMLLDRRDGLAAGGALASGAMPGGAMPGGAMPGPSAAPSRGGPD
jgi:2-C-methyl-D-erythritol 4-phosphate cytidylyltransferase